MGVTILGRGLDSGGEPSEIVMRPSDGAVLVAHVPAGFDASGLDAGAAQRFDSGAWVPLESGTVDPCDSGSHANLEAHDLPTGTRDPVAPGVWLLQACGGRADAPAVEREVTSYASPSQWLDGCDDEQWLWLWTPRSCAELRRRGPDAPTGVYTIDPDGPGGEAAGPAFCDQRSLGGGWTQVLGVTQGDDGGAVVTRGEDRRDGLELASMRRGYVPARTLSTFPAQDTSLSFRFFCQQQQGGRVHIVTTGAPVARFLTEVTLPPAAAGSFYQVDMTMQVDPQTIFNTASEDAFDDGGGLGGRPYLWGFDLFCGFCEQTGRWGTLEEGQDPDDRIADQPFVIRSDPTLNGQSREFRAMPGLLQCDGGKTGKPGLWLAFVR